MGKKPIDPNKPEQGPSGPTPDIIVVRLADLLIDYANYQRTIIESLAKTLTAEWDEKAAGLLIVNIRPSGAISLIDGTHRREAAMRVGYTSLRAYAYRGMTIAEEAALFLNLQSNRRHHSALGKWRAHLAAGTPEHRILSAMLDRLGLRVEYGGGVNTLACPDTLVGIAHKDMRRGDPPDRVEEVIVFIRATWGDDPLSLTGGVLLGVDRFLYKYGHLLDHALARHKLSQVPLETLARQSALIQRANIVSRTVAFCTALQQEYDRNRRTNRLEKTVSDA